MSYVVVRDLEILRDWSLYSNYASEGAYQVYSDIGQDKTVYLDWENITKTSDNERKS